MSAQASGWPFIAALPLALVVCGVLGFVVERWLVSPLYHRPFDTLVVTWGLSLLIRKCAEAIFGLGYKSINEPLSGTLDVLGATYPRYRLVLIVVSVAGAGRAACGGTAAAAPARASRRWSTTPISRARWASA